ncbi:MAG TPA: outer membrane beta-barrel protein [Vicinamibacterales bacterium]|nr:outer membrane beta-barrel protein [Vicinamibacterales bacterium]
MTARRGLLKALAGVALPALLTVLLASKTSAQIVEPDTSRSRVRLGPVLLNPTVDLSNLGVDTNVFNDPSGQERRDFTFTLSPKTDAWMKLGPTWVTGNVREDLLWYETYASERAANTTANGAWIIPLNRLSFSVGAGIVSARDRPGFEIDARVPRREVVYNGAVEARVGARTHFGAQGSRRRITFSDDAMFLGASLKTELNRVTTTGSLTVRHELTPLTSVTVDVGRSEDRFEFSSLRDSNSTTAGVSVAFDPSALIKGTARVGYRDFEPLSAGVPSFKGTTAAVDLSYVLLGATKFGVQLTRDVQFSYDANQPYYVQSGIAGSVTQQIYGPLDVMAGAGLYDLAYRTLPGVPNLLADRTDTNRSYNGGVGYHLSPDVRVGVKAEKLWRDSQVDGRQYKGYRIGMTLTYGT